MSSPAAAPVQTGDEAAMEEDGIEGGSPSVATKLRFSSQSNDNDSVEAVPNGCTQSTLATHDYL